MNAVRFITPYCRKNGTLLLNEQKFEKTQIEDNYENKFVETLLQKYLINEN